MPIPGYITAGVVPAPRRREAVAILTREALRAEAILTQRLQGVHPPEAVPIQHPREVRREAVPIPLPAEVQAQVVRLRTTLRAAAHRSVPPHRVPVEVPLPAHIAAEAAVVAVEDVVKL